MSGSIIEHEPDASEEEIEAAMLADAEEEMRWLDPHNGLSLKHKMFVAEYLTDFNAVAATERAGYSRVSKFRQSNRLLNYPAIKVAIARGVAKRMAALEITGDDVVLELARIAFADVRKLYDAEGNLLAPNELPEDIAGAVQSVRSIGSGDQMATEYKLANKIEALKVLGSNRALATESTVMEARGENARVIVVPKKDLLPDEDGNPIDDEA